MNSKKGCEGGHLDSSRAAPPTNRSGIGGTVGHVTVSQWLLRPRRTCVGRPAPTVLVWQAAGGDSMGRPSSSVSHHLTTTPWPGLAALEPGDGFFEREKSSPPRPSTPKERMGFGGGLCCWARL